MLGADVAGGERGADHVPGQLVPGQEIFVFRAKAKGTTSVVFEYERPWEDEALKTMTYTFIID